LKLLMATAQEGELIDDLIADGIEPTEN